MYPAASPFLWNSIAKVRHAGHWARTEVSVIGEAALCLSVQQVDTEVTEIHSIIYSML
jgi:hypothetical protein